jgi:hypothetical protein
MQMSRFGFSYSTPTETYSPAIINKGESHMATKALLVGIAKYANPANNLPGINNDMPAITGVMARFGIMDIEIIRDVNATSENIKNGLNSLVQDAKEGDVRIFYISSHGTLLPPGFSGTDDPDGRDEAIVPYEGTLSSLILDNWLAAYLRESIPKGVSFWGIYDCCHSGDLYKRAIIDGLANEDPNEVPKQLDMSDLVIDALPPRLIFRETALTTKNLVLDGVLNKSFHLAAAEPEKAALCKTIGSATRSVFTYALEQAIRVGQTVAEFEVAVTTESAKITKVHTPQIACAPDAKETKLFS